MLLLTYLCVMYNRWLSADSYLLTYVQLIFVYNVSSLQNSTREWLVTSELRARGRSHYSLLCVCSNKPIELISSEYTSPSPDSELANVNLASQLMECFTIIDTTVLSKCVFVLSPSNNTMNFIVAIISKHTYLSAFINTSAKEVMFSSALVCLFVCLFVCYLAVTLLKCIALSAVA